MDSHWIDLVVPLDLEVLAKLAEPLWIWSVPESLVIWANPAALAQWGVTSLERMQALRFDRAMPAVARLERMARNDTGGIARERLVFWTPRGSLSLRCQCRSVSLYAQPGLILVRPVPPVDDDTGKQQSDDPSTANAPDEGAPGDFANDGAPAAVPPSAPAMSAEDARTLAEIARLIRARSGLPAPAASFPNEPPLAQQPSNEDTASAPALPHPEAKRPAPEAGPPILKDVEFIARIGHEVRTPLSSIIGFSEIIQDEQLGPIGNAKYKEYIDDILDSARHALSLVNDLLDLSQVEAGALPLHPVPIDIGELAGRVLASLVPQAERAGVSLLSAIDPNLPRLLADRRSLRQVLLNLLANAIRFTDRGGRVTVAARRTLDGGIGLHVTDTGIGMTAAEVERAMLPFGQGMAAPGRGQGTGLGLPLTRSLAVANGATFRIESAAGAGTHVEVMFPPDRLASVE